MPIIEVKLFGELSPNHKEQLIKETSNTVSTVLNLPLSTVRVLLHELPTENWGIEGESVKKRLEKTVK
ncbi:4-oxalocrotonate tautomerase family protein [Niallia endozanthoxylica]|uniref:4-oxalocrotonate tautomerase family protein n=1 Tax=Niallia endozanthoxylica TaxID=2036016 RepID=A0A5J5H709_9BACI|nr:4-oxalocrotonate tautomerase family protein [Niallia endozanthoxylica]KAA9016475.1 4-oxalocrotonate tautomerase family protein [Niallia endozanthoxylica]